MLDLVRIRDAARVAAKAAHPTDIVVTKTGFRVVARKGGVRAHRSVTFDDVDLAPGNPLVEAVWNVNRDLAA